MANNAFSGYTNAQIVTFMRSRKDPMIQELVDRLVGVMHENEKLREEQKQLDDVKAKLEFVTSRKDELKQALQTLQG